MVLKWSFELSATLNTDKFEKIFNKVCLNSSHIQEVSDNEYIDHTFSDDGFLIKYRNSQYKKKIRLLVDPQTILQGGDSDAEKIVRKVEKFLHRCFSSQLCLDDFTLSGLLLYTDIQVGHNHVADYIRVLQRIGKVKGFSPIKDEALDADTGFFLKGNSNAIRFHIYDLSAILPKEKGKLRAEVQLTKQKAIQLYTKSTDPREQLKELMVKLEHIFLDTFACIIPYGDFHKKGAAVDLIRQRIKDITLRRKMLRLVALIPEKKSLHLAQKEMSSRNMDEIMVTFAKINLSPVTISKRHDVKYLENIYTYLDF